MSRKYPAMPPPNFMPVLTRRPRRKRRKRLAGMAVGSSPTAVAGGYSSPVEKVSNGEISTVEDFIKQHLVEYSQSMSRPLILIEQNGNSVLAPEEKINAFELEMKEIERELEVLCKLSDKEIEWLCRLSYRDKFGEWETKFEQLSLAADRCKNIKQQLSRYIAEWDSSQSYYLTSADSNLQQVIAVVDTHKLLCPQLESPTQWYFARVDQLRQIFKEGKSYLRSRNKEKQNTLYIINLFNRIAEKVKNEEQRCNS